MPRYFFDCDTGERQVRDPQGMELPDLDAVSSEAYIMLQDLVRGEMPEGVRIYTASVRDEAGLVVYRGEMHIVGGRFSL